MPEQPETQISEQASLASAAVAQRPQPPRVFEREPEPEPKSWVDKLIRRLAV